MFKRTLLFYHKNNSVAIDAASELTKRLSKTIILCKLSAIYI